jgi:hypothetical protein
MSETNKKELWSSKEVCDFMSINLNNLRQIQYRGAIKWVKKVGRDVFYLADDVRAYKAKRDDRNQG